MKKLSKTAKIADVLLFVYLACICLIAVFGTVVLFMADASSPQSVSFGNATFALASGCVMDIAAFRAITLSTNIVNIVKNGMSVMIIHRILETFKNENPFDPSNAKRLKDLGYVFLVGGAVKTVLGVISQHAVYSGIRFGELLEGGNIIDCSVKYNIELTFLLWVCLAFVLSCIFEHGALIKKKADEIQCNDTSL